jgi:hypothetical protein
LSGTTHVTWGKRASTRLSPKLLEEVNDLIAEAFAQCEHGNFDVGYRPEKTMMLSCIGLWGINKASQWTVLPMKPRRHPGQIRHQAHLPDGTTLCKMRQAVITTRATSTPGADLPLVRAALHAPSSAGDEPDPAHLLAGEIVDGMLLHLHPRPPCTRWRRRSTGFATPKLDAPPRGAAGGRRVEPVLGSRMIRDGSDEFCPTRAIVTLLGMFFVQFVLYPPKTRIPGKVAHVDP